MKMIFLYLTIGLMALSANPTLAAEKPVLTVYTYDAIAADWGPGPKIKAGFEKTCGCTVDFVASYSSIGTLRKIQLEQKNPKADVILGLDTNLAEIARQTGLFTEHGADITGLDLPVTWSDSQFLPFDYGYFAFVYDSEKLANPPTSFKDLATTGDDFKIIIQDPRSATPGLGLLLWIK
ncbi:MAG TPA: thiamine ABC transporter substrate-binding protein, partial [Rhodospirillales bacterium]|nr:thiamine ABC transporter substrate-binding protein [Rhodospirillales bacterium]